MAWYFWMTTLNVIFSETENAQQQKHIKYNEVFHYNDEKKIQNES